MRFFKQHPALATLIILAIIGVATPVAYALVDRVFLSIDTNQSESEIEADVKDQLSAAGHGNATVKATKTDHEYSVAIQSEDPALSKLDLDVDTPDGKTHHLHIDVPPTLPVDQQQAVSDALSKAVQRPNHESDADMEKVLRADLAAAGVKNATVKVTADSVSIVVAAP